MGELEKALLKAARPSIFFVELKKMDRLKPWFAGLKALPEEEWRRVMAVLDAAAALRPQSQRPLEFMLAACCAGFEPEAAQDFLTRLTSAAAVTRYMLNAARAARSARVPKSRRSSSLRERARASSTMSSSRFRRTQTHRRT